MGLVLAKFTLVGLTFGRGAKSNTEDMGLHRIKAGLQRPTREQYEEAQRNTGKTIKEVQAQDERKRDGIIRIACAILSGKSGLVNLEEVVEKATEIYNKIDAKL